MASRMASSRLAIGGARREDAGEVHAGSHQHQEGEQQNAEQKGSCRIGEDIAQQAGLDQAGA